MRNKRGKYYHHYVVARFFFFGCEKEGNLSIGQSKKRKTHDNKIECKAATINIRDAREMDTSKQYNKTHNNSNYIMMIIIFI